MISLLALLLSSATDASHTRDRRARAHELRGRLGLRTQRDTGTRARYRYLLDQHDYLDQRALLDLWDPLLAREGLHYESDPSYVLQPRPGRRLDHGLRVFLPLSGQSSSYDPLIPWSRVVLDVSFDEPRPMSIAVQQMPMIRDWYVAERPDLTGLSWHDAVAAARAWHEQFITSGFRLPAPDATVLARWPDGATLQRLDDKDELRDEGTSMGHCVGGPIAQPGDIAPGGGHYWQAVRDGELVILSYRDADGVPQATLELHPVPSAQLGDIQGPENTPVRSEIYLRSLGALTLAGLGDAQPGRLELYADEDSQIVAERFFDLVEENGEAISLVDEPGSTDVANEIVSSSIHYRMLQRTPLVLDMSELLEGFDPLEQMSVESGRVVLTRLRYYLMYRADLLDVKMRWAHSEHRHTIPPALRNAYTREEWGLQFIEACFMTRADIVGLEVTGGWTLCLRLERGPHRKWQWALRGDLLDRGRAGSPPQSETDMQGGGRLLGTADPFESGQPERLLREHVDLPSAQQMKEAQESVADDLRSALYHYGPSNLEAVVPPETWLLPTDEFEWQMRVLAAEQAPELESDDLRDVVAAALKAHLAPASGLGMERFREAVVRPDEHEAAGEWAPRALVVVFTEYLGAGMQSYPGWMEDWERASELVSERIGRPVYFESVNPAVAALYPA